MTDNYEEEYRIIKYMGEAYFTKWKAIRDVFRPKLNEGVIYTNIAFTPHDYDRHCRNIYRILEWLIPEKALYDGTPDFTKEEIYILNVAVILHDFVMSKSIDKRDSHGAEMFTVIYEHCKGEDSLIKNYFDENQKKALAFVIYGHSDIKNTGNDKKETIPEVPSSIDGEREIIKVRLLSSLLRLADELDVSFKRIDKLDYSTYFVGKESEGSKDHWRQCEIFGYAKSDQSNRKILLPVRSELYKSNPMENSINLDILNKDIPLILKVKNKINGELEYLNNKVFNEAHIKNWLYSEVEIESEMGEIKELIKNYKKKMNL